MSDLISRQAAISLIESHMRTAEEPYQRATRNKIMNYAFEVAIRCLLKLPSVELKTGELVRCKDCDWLEKSDNSLQWRCKRYGFYPTGEYYCAGAEPKGEDE